MTYEERRELDRINWLKEGIYIHISQAEAKELVAWYKENGELNLAKVRRLDWLDDGRYRLERNGCWGRLYCTRNSRHYVYEWIIAEDTPEQQKIGTAPKKRIRAKK